MTSEPQTRRTYRSPKRTEQAARTRATITAAARRLFERDGFAATTIAAVAKEAGVSQQTVYAVFGNKPALVRAILEQMEETAEASTWRKRIAEEQDPARILAAFAQWTRAFFEASSPSFSIAQEAMSELTDLAAQGDAHRRQALASLVQRLAGMGALRDGLSEQHATDRAWLLTGLQTYFDATERCAWTPEAYAEWLGDTLAQQILAGDRVKA
ncbi:helix-turn-helix domain-containing protein [Ammonicoccus fulvus]|uniref:Helix-turn-helix domain-containing protein n=1 Tax=Ammonicoccus fulvus TaxID=3138240 RepID=A0ABZ3FVE7_9ACTN